jgi:A/G-specific adenine glycosylase
MSARSTRPGRSVAPDEPPRPVPPAARAAILAWYDAAGRRLAFRSTRDPYAVLVSELMAQQTQAGRAAEAWTAWMTRFPTVRALARAPAADVLRAWAGLGYNRRAINLHRAATAIVLNHEGRVPDTVEALGSLAGVGPYTARAVAAIAFDRPVGAVDTNVRRVLGRIVAGGPGAFTRAGMQALADASVPVDRPGDWTHALMDVGQGPCRPANPRCADCPAAAWCAYAAGHRPAVVHDAPSRPTPAFATTNRWLRGRILARARDASDGEWVAFDAPMGEHDRRAVDRAVAALAAEGLLEARSARGRTEARLPT